MFREAELSFESNRGLFSSGSRELFRVMLRLVENCLVSGVKRVIVDFGVDMVVEWSEMGGVSIFFWKFNIA